MRKILAAIAIAVISTTATAEPVRWGGDLYSFTTICDGKTRVGSFSHLQAGPARMIAWQHVLKPITRGDGVMPTEPQNAVVMIWMQLARKPSPTGFTQIIDLEELGIRMRQGIPEIPLHTHDPGNAWVDITEGTTIATWVRCIPINAATKGQSLVYSLKAWWNW